MLVTEMKTWEDMFADNDPVVPRILEGKTDWYFAPMCRHLCSLRNHGITRHADGTISATPSIVCPHPGCTTHGFLERNEWRDC